MLKTVVKTFQIVDALAEAEQPVGVRELARRAAIGRSTAQEILTTLLQEQYVRRDEETGRYALGIRWWERGCLVIERHGLREVARPFVKQLSAITSETVHLAILDETETETVYVDKVETQHTVRAYTRLGGRAPAYCVATGKALLAYREDVAARLAKRGLKRFTPATISHGSSLLRHLAEIRRRGYSVNRGEWRADVWGIAAPVWDSSGSVMAALGVTLPLTRVTEDRAHQLAPRVVDVAQRLSRALGFRTGGSGSSTSVRFHVSTAMADGDGKPTRTRPTSRPGRQRRQRTLARQSES